MKYIIIFLFCFSSYAITISEVTEMIRWAKVDCLQKWSLTCDCSEATINGSLKANCPSNLTWDDCKKEYSYRLELCVDCCKALRNEEGLLRLLQESKQ